MGFSFPPPALAQASIAFAIAAVHFTLPPFLCSKFRYQELSIGKLGILYLLEDLRQLRPTYSAIFTTVIRLGDESPGLDN